MCWMHLRTHLSADWTFVYFADKVQNLAGIQDRMIDFDSQEQAEEASIRDKQQMLEGK